MSHFSDTVLAALHGLPVPRRYCFKLTASVFPFPRFNPASHRRKPRLRLTVLYEQPQLTCVRPSSPYPGASFPSLTGQAGSEKYLNHTYYEVLCRTLHLFCSTLLSYHSIFQFRHPAMHPFIFFVAFVGYLPIFLLHRIYIS